MGAYLQAPSTNFFLNHQGPALYLNVVNGSGRLAQLARASRLHREGRGFESLSAYHVKIALA